MKNGEPDRRMYKRLKLLVIATIGASIVLGGLLSFWAWYPYNPIDTYPKPYKIVYPKDKVVTQGGYITYEFTYDKYSDVIPVITRQFVDGIIFNVAGNPTATVTNQGHGTVQVQIKIPETLPPGIYHLHIVATYQMNPIRIWVNESDTEDFVVIENTK